MTEVLDRLQALTDTGLQAVYAEADELTRAAALREAARRDQADRLAAARSALAVIREEGDRQAYANFRQADNWCRGVLLSRAGKAAGITDEQVLWRMPREEALRFASAELAEFWEFIAPRVTSADYVRQRAAEGRAARMEAREQAEAAANEITTEGEISDGQHQADGAGLADNEPGSFRCGQTPGEAPQRAGGTVPGGGRGSAEARPGRPVSAGARRPAGPAEPARGAGGMTAAFTTFADIDPLPTEPLWAGFWPRGEVVGWYGEGGIGKGRSELDLAARVTRGDAMPFCTGRTRPGAVILVLPEDHPSEQVRPRLDAAGADVSRVIDMTRLPTGSRFKLSASMTKDGDVGKLRECIELLKITCAACRELMAGGTCPACGGAEDMNPRLVIIDPLTACIGFGSISTVAGARRAVEPLQDVAASTGVTILLVMHCTKDGQLQGSAGIRQALRLLYKVGKDTNPMVRVISLEKANNQGETADAKFTLEGTSRGVEVIWLDRAEQDRRSRSWRTVAEVDVRQVPPAMAAPAPVQGPRYVAAAGVQQPGETTSAIRILDYYDATDRGARLARVRCEADPAFPAGAQWRAGQNGEQLAKLAEPDGTLRWFAVTAMAAAAV